MVMLYFLGILTATGLTFDFSVWYAGSSALALVVAVALTGYGFHTALAGRSLLKDELLES